MGLLDRFRRRDPALPTFVVIGAMKAGTTSLHRYLASHPDVSMSQVKETNFFIAERNADRGVDWYREQFAAATTARGESSPNYTKRDLFAGVPARMHALLPSAKLIYVVRDPVDRAVSHAVHAARKGRLAPEDLERLFDPPGSPAAPAAEGDRSPAARHLERYLQASRYHHQLTAYLDHYPLRRILVIASEDLRSDRRATMRQVYAFVGVDPDHDSQDLDRLYHTSADRPRSASEERVVTTPTLTPAQRRHVAAQLQADADRFRELTGQPFPQWSV